MSQYYRVKVDGNGKAYLIDDAGDKLPPQQNMEIAEILATTAEQPRYVYFGWSEKRQLHKIGISVDPERRSKEVDMEILFTITCEMWGEFSAFALEQKLHKIYTATGQHVDGEWFKLTDVDIRYWQPGPDDKASDTLEIASDLIAVLEVVDSPKFDDEIEVLPHTKLLNSVLHMWSTGFDKEIGEMYWGIIGARYLLTKYRSVHPIFEDIANYVEKFAKALFKRMQQEWDKSPDVLSQLVEQP